MSNRIPFSDFLRDQQQQDGNNNANDVVNDTNNKQNNARDGPEKEPSVIMLGDDGASATGRNNNNKNNREEQQQRKQSSTQQHHHSNTTTIIHFDDTVAAASDDDDKDENDDDDDDEKEIGESPQQVIATDNLAGSVPMLASKLGTTVLTGNSLPQHQQHTTTTFSTSTKTFSNSINLANNNPNNNSNKNPLSPTTTNSNSKDLLNDETDSIKRNNNVIIDESSCTAAVASNDGGAVESLMTSSSSTKKKKIDRSPAPNSTPALPVHSTEDNNNTLAVSSNDRQQHKQQASAAKNGEGSSAHNDDDTPQQQQEEPSLLEKLFPAVTYQNVFASIFHPNDDFALRANKLVAGYSVMFAPSSIFFGLWVLLDGYFFLLKDEWAEGPEHGPAHRRQATASLIAAIGYLAQAFGFLVPWSHIRFINKTPETMRHWGLWFHYAGVIFSVIFGVTHPDFPQWSIMAVHLAVITPILNAENMWPHAIVVFSCFLTGSIQSELKLMTMEDYRDGRSGEKIFYLVMAFSAVMLILFMLSSLRDEFEAMIKRSVQTQDFGKRIAFYLNSWDLPGVEKEISEFGNYYTARFVDPYLIESLSMVTRTIRRCARLVPSRLIDDYEKYYEQYQQDASPAVAQQQRQVRAVVMHLRIRDFDEICDRVCETVEEHYQRRLVSSSTFTSEDRPRRNSSGSEGLKKFMSSDEQHQQQQSSKKKNVKLMRAFDRVLGDFYAAIDNIITQQCRGSIFNFCTDNGEIVACWGAPAPCEYPAALACSAALQIVNVVKDEFEERFNKEILHHVETHSGADHFTPLSSFSVSIGLSTGAVRMQKVRCNTCEERNNGDDDAGEESQANRILAELRSVTIEGSEACVKARALSFAGEKERQQQQEFHQRRMSSSSVLTCSAIPTLSSSAVFACSTTFGEAMSIPVPKFARPEFVAREMARVRLDVNHEGEEPITTNPSSSGLISTTEMPSSPKVSSDDSVNKSMFFGCVQLLGVARPEDQQRIVAQLKSEFASHRVMKNLLVSLATTQQRQQEEEQVKAGRTEQNQQSSTFRRRHDRPLKPSSAAAHSSGEEEDMKARLEEWQPSQSGAVDIDLLDFDLQQEDLVVRRMSKKFLNFLDDNSSYHHHHHHHQQHPARLAALPENPSMPLLFQHDDRNSHRASNRNTHNKNEKLMTPGGQQQPQHLFLAPYGFESEAQFDNNYNNNPMSLVIDNNNMNYLDQQQQQVEFINPFADVVEATRESNYRPEKDQAELFDLYYYLQDSGDTITVGQAILDHHSRSNKMRSLQEQEQQQQQQKLHQLFNGNAGVDSLTTMSTDYITKLQQPRRPSDNNNRDRSSGGLAKHLQQQQIILQPREHHQQQRPRRPRQVVDDDVSPQQQTSSLSNLVLPNTYLNQHILHLHNIQLKEQEPQKQQQRNFVNMIDFITNNDDAAAIQEEIEQHNRENRVQQFVDDNFEHNRHHPPSVIAGGETPASSQEFSSVNLLNINNNHNNNNNENTRSSTRHRYVYYADGDDPTLFENKRQPHVVVQQQQKQAHSSSKLLPHEVVSHHGEVEGEEEENNYGFVDFNNGKYEAEQIAKIEAQLAREAQYLEHRVENKETPSSVKLFRFSIEAEDQRQLWKADPNNSNNSNNNKTATCHQQKRKIQHLNNTATTSGGAKEKKTTLSLWASYESESRSQQQKIEDRKHNSSRFSDVGDEEESNNNQHDVDNASNITPISKNISNKTEGTESTDNNGNNIINKQHSKQDPYRFHMKHLFSSEMKALIRCKAKLRNQSSLRIIENNSNSNNEKEKDGAGGGGVLAALLLWNLANTILYESQNIHVALAILDFLIEKIKMSEQEERELHQFGAATADDDDDDRPELTNKNNNTNSYCIAFNNSSNVYGSRDFFNERTILYRRDFILNEMQRAKNNFQKQQEMCGNNIGDCIDRKYIPISSEAFVLRL